MTIMCGKVTLTMVMSMMTITVVSITAMLVSQRGAPDVSSLMSAQRRASC